jgi:hypothetical protein
MTTAGFLLGLATLTGCGGGSTPVTATPSTATPTSTLAAAATTRAPATTQQYASVVAKWIPDIAHEVASLSDCPFHSRRPAGCATARWSR